MKIYKRAIWLISISFLFQTIITSCCDCDNETFYDGIYKEIEINNFFNNRYDSQFRDTLKPEAVSFRIFVGIELPEDYYAVSVTNFLKNFSFNNAYALYCDCGPIVLTKNHISDFSITTLLDIDDNIKTGDDVTNLFYGSTNNYNDLYLEIDELKEYIFLQDRDMMFFVYYSKRIENDKAKFLFKFTLEDGTILEAENNLVILED